MSKEIYLAKLMAEEDIDVLFKNVDTAAFDLKNRVLVLPSYIKSMPEDVRYGLTAHEISHALNTPLNERCGEDLVNVLEDIRIEKIIKRKYRGSARYMRNMGKIFFDEEWFGTKSETEINSMNFIDRLNVYAKTFESNIGIDIKFSDEEQVFVKRAFLTSSFDDVLKLADELKDFAENESESSSGDVITDNCDSVDSMDEGNGADNGEGSESGDDNATDNSDSVDSANDEQEGSDDENSASSGTSGHNVHNEGDFESETLDAMKKKIESLTNDDDEETLSILLPNKQLSKIRPFDDFFTVYESTISDYLKSKREKKAKKFVKEAKPQVNHLIKQFEMRRNAQAWANRTNQRTGEIDCDALSQYKFTDDIFMSTDLLPNGKNHGLVMYVDFSGSMSVMIEDVCQQIAILSMFARGAGIKFRVIAFTSTSIFEHYGCDKIGRIEDDSPFPSFRPFYDAVELSNDSMKQKDFDRFIETMVNIDDFFMYVSGGTPLFNCLVDTSLEVVNWRNRHNIEVLNTIVFTDGLSQGLSVDYKGERIYNKKHEYIDRVTKITYSGRFDEAEVYDIYKNRTQSRLSVYYAGVARNLKYRFYNSAEIFDAIARARKDGVAVFDHMSDVVDVYFIYLVNKKISTFDSANDIDIPSGKAAASAFVKKARAKKKSKVFANYLMDLIA